MRIRPPSPTGIAICAVIVLVFGAGAAVGAKLITGKDIKDGSVTTKDIKNNNLTTKDIKDGSLKGADIKDGSIGAKDLSAGAKASVYSGPNWGIVDRNVIGNGDSYLRAGPVAGPASPTTAPPFGVGSLGMRTGSPDDKTSFGDQVDFIGMPLADVAQLSYWVFTTTENNDVDPTNLPNIQFEIDANLSPEPSVDFTTATFAPPAQLPGWHQIDAVTEGEWFLTGTEGTDTGCTQVTTCTLAELQTAAPDATILTVQFNKGRDNAFSGAVDGLQINSDVYDFEPLGVLVTAAP